MHNCLMICVCVDVWIWLVSLCFIYSTVHTIVTQTTRINNPNKYTKIHPTDFLIKNPNFKNFLFNRFKDFSIPSKIQIGFLLIFLSSDNKLSSVILDYLISINLNLFDIKLIGFLFGFFYFHFCLIFISFVDFILNLRGE